MHLQKGEDSLHDELKLPIVVDHLSRGAILNLL